MIRADDVGGYRTWAAAHSSPGGPELARMQGALVSMPFRPLITVTLTGSRNAQDVDRSINSLKAQSYPAWHVAVDEVDGAFVAVLGAGDQLAPHALYEAVRLLSREPDAEIIYADCDEIDVKGQRSAPDLKPAWDPDLLLAYNYLAGFVLYKAAVFAAAGGLGAEPYALALRATAATAPACIYHLPAILCHRVPLRPDVSERSITQAYLGPARCVEAAPLFPARNRVRWPIPSPAPLVSVIVPSRDRGDLLARCAEGLLERTDYPAIEVLVVDNGSSDDAALALLEQLARSRRVQVLRMPGPFNYSALNNLAATAACGHVILLLNDDVEVVEAGWLAEMVSHAMRPDVGAVGAKLLYPDGRLQHGGVVFAPGRTPRHTLQFTYGNDPGWNGQLAVTRTVSAVTGACLALRRSVFDEVGGFDADAFPVSYSDVDLCLRITERGYRVVWTPFAVLRHHESASRGRPQTAIEQLREDQALTTLQRRWRGEMECDPFQNPNLKLDATTTALLVDRVPPI